MLANFFVTIPKDILDAAKIDGCSHLRILWVIVLPLSKPVIITLMVVNAIWVWNELLIAMVFLQADKLKTLMTGLILFKSRNILDLPMIMSGLVVTTIPMFVLFIIGIRYFMKGLYAGSIKG
jgi:ABC-type glycerol-3-phosphate transport system permease component